MWRYLDSIQIECLGMRDYARSMIPTVELSREDSWSWFEHQKEKEKNVVMTVEATALSENDIPTSMQAMSRNVVSGTNAVGVVHHFTSTAEEAGIKPGMRIATILQPNGANARYLSLQLNDVLPVPRHLDAADITCIITTFLPAFQALHHCRAPPYRYSRTCLKGRRVLIVGGDQLVAQATIRLSQLAGAKTVYICAPRVIMTRLQKQNAIVLDENPSNWPEEIGGEMDIVVDYQFPQNFAEVTMTMAAEGRLVCCTPSNWSKVSSWWSDLSQLLEWLQLATVKRATLFDFRQNYHMNRYGLKEDLQFLLTSLNRRHIRPEVDRFVKLSDIPEVHREILSKPRTGSIIVEPWRE